MAVSPCAAVAGWRHEMLPVEDPGKERPLSLAAAHGYLAFDQLWLRSSARLVAGDDVGTLVDNDTTRSNG